MKKPILYIVALGVLSLGLQAQNIKIATADMTRLYNEYYKTKEANAKIQESVDKAKEETEALVKEGQDLVEEYKEILERANNPALTEEAQSKAQSDAETHLQTIREKEQEVQQYQVATQRSLQQRQRTYRDLFLDEIKNVVLEVAKEKGDNLVLDSSGLTALGIQAVLFSDPAWDITGEVLTRINADAPEETP